MHRKWGCRPRLESRSGTAVSANEVRELPCGGGRYRKCIFCHIAAAACAGIRTFSAINYKIAEEKPRTLESMSRKSHGTGYCFYQNFFLEWKPLRTRPRKRAELPLAPTRETSYKAPTATSEVRSLVEEQSSFPQELARPDIAAGSVVAHDFEPQRGLGVAETPLVARRVSWT